MNEVFIIGKVITEVKFDFILNSKHISVAGFRTVTVCDEQEIEIIAYIVIKKHCFLIYFKIVVGSFYRNFAISLNVISWYCSDCPQAIGCCNKKEYRTITRHICEELNEEMRELRLSDRIFLKI